MKLERDRSTTTILILVLLLIIAACYIGVEKYQAYKQQQQLTVFQQGAQYGYQQAVIQVMQQAATCQQVPLNIGNQTINIVAINCLR